MNYEAVYRTAPATPGLLKSPGVRKLFQRKYKFSRISGRVLDVVLEIFHILSGNNFFPEFCPKTCKIIYPERNFVLKLYPIK